MRNFVFGLLALGVMTLASVGSATMAPTNGSHRSSLAAIVTLRDGTTQNLTLEGVGCNISICSRVQVREFDRTIWLDEVSEVTGISRSAGSVTATVHMEGGATRQARIVSGNRVLYVRNQAGDLGKLDLGQVAKIDF